jgi:CMP/dCMP kinase
MIIAIDGPAASGKGTIAKQVAAIYGLHHLDTGLIYRAVAKAVLDAGYPPENAEKAIEAAIALDPATFDEAALKAQPITEAASVVAAIADVRQALMNYQREFATRPPGAVLDGRDIGTVICPEATCKIFVTASDDARATRRALELRTRGEKVDYAAVLEDIRRRDRRDCSRAAAPLKPAPDAVVLDTTKLDVDAAFKAALAIVEAACAGVPAQTAV